MLLNIPTSRDIYIEIAGVKVAVVESYKVNSSRENTVIKEIGNDNAICIVAGNLLHNIELKRVYFTSTSQFHVDFFNLFDFTIVIAKPGKRIHYTGCQWTNISDGVSLDGHCVETITVLATGRTQLQV